LPCIHHGRLGSTATVVAGAVVAGAVDVGAAVAELAAAGEVVTTGDVAVDVEVGVSPDVGVAEDPLSAHAATAAAMGSVPAPSIDQRMRSRLDTAAMRPSVAPRVLASTRASS
jgi:UDP-3-O-[3-hydroxymyristoyl] glucosamine N-acyltransferase